MIVFDEDDNVIANGTLFITDVFRLQEPIAPFGRKLKIKLRKEERIDYNNSYPFEVYYATKVFNYFMQIMLTDVLTQKVSYKHNHLKSISLVTVTHPSVIRALSKYKGILPTMPVLQIELKMKHKSGYFRRSLRLYDDLFKLWKEKTLSGQLTAGVKETRDVNYYVPMVKTRFPVLDVKVIKKILKEGLNALFIAVKSTKVDIYVSLGQRRPKVCAVLNTNSYTIMLPHYQLLVRYLQKFKDNTYYAVFTDEEQAKIEAGEKVVSGLAIYTLAYVKLFAKNNKKGQRYKHIYKINRSTRSTYSYYIQRTNVKTNRIKYIYRRINERYEPINHPK